MKDRVQKLKILVFIDYFSRLFKYIWRVFMSKYIQLRQANL